MKCLGKFLLTCLFLLFSVIIYAQQKHTISGYVKDSTSNESVTGASVTVKGRTQSVSSNQYGFYSVTLPEGEYVLTVSHVAYETSEIRIRLSKDERLNFDLAPRIVSSSEVVVYSKKREANIRSAQMGKVELSINQIKSIPAFAGEVDPMKVLQLLPGVRNAGEGNSGLYVRG